jgi:hypothetical protein
VSRQKKPKANGPVGSNSSRRAIRRFVAVLFTLALVVGLVWGLSRLGDEARRGIGTRNRYSVRFADIECEPPPGFDRPTFLSEVRYVSKFPELFQSLDPELTSKLNVAFSAHPWVASFNDVLVEPNGTVRVKLRYRTPALAVRTADGMRIVDAASVLLPLATDPTGLPELVTLAPVPAISAGQVWLDDNVKRAVQLTEIHHPTKLEKTEMGWRLTMPDGKTLILER